jgi:RHS repeat-associated protein
VRSRTLFRTRRIQHDLTQPSRTGQPHTRPSTAFRSTAARRWLAGAAATLLAVSLAGASPAPAVAAAGGPSVPLPGTAPVAVSPQPMAGRAPDEASNRALHGNQPAGTAPDGGGVPTATSLSPSASWNVSTQSGDFTWAYPLRVPPVPGDLQPKLALAYASSTVDGRTSVTNNQPSWVGDGWDLSLGFVERSYGACAEDSEGGTAPPQVGDLCWKSDNATASFNGGGGMLIHDAGTGWHLKADDGSRIEKLTCAGNGAHDGECWRITTVDGTQYWFGSDSGAGSVWTVPVFGDDSGEPCHGGTFDASSCTQAYRWNIDKVVDRQGNLVRYRYDPETNSYGRNKKDTAVSYVRGGTLREIEYGLHQDVAAPAAGRVLFGTADRCVPGSSCDLARAQDWPDTPLAERCVAATCKDHYAPTFWSTRRLASITTQIRRANGYADVDKWALDQQFPDPGDGEKAALWLHSITHSGLAGGQITLPPVTFEGAKMPNRVVRVDGIGPLNRFRITGIVSEAGGVISIRYADPDCSTTSLPAAPQTNTMRCFPVRWTPHRLATRTDYFHKYVVAQVSQSDRISANPVQVTSYEYLDGAAWHYDTSEFTPATSRTWNEYRGFGRVRVRTGAEHDPTGPIGLTEQRFYRGMDADTLPDNGHRAIAVTDSEQIAHTDHDWLAGFGLESVTYNGDGGAVISKTITTPDWAGPTATRDSFKAYRVNPGTQTAYAALEGGARRVTRTVTSYDDLGQPVTVDDQGDIDTDADDRCTTTTYIRNTAKWLVTFPSRSETVAVHCGQTPDFPADAIGDNRTAYDGQQPGAAPRIGNVTSTEQLDQRPASGPVYYSRGSTRYDVHGRITAFTDALDHTTTTAFTPATGGPVSRVTLTNPRGDATITDLEIASGQPTIVTDANGRKTETVYDALGRVSEAWLASRPRTPGALGTGNVRYSYAVRADAPSAITTTTLGPNGTYADRKTLYDGLLRIRQTQSPAAGGGRLIVDTRYDSQGRQFKVTQPYFTDTPIDDTLWVASDVAIAGLTRLEYDGVGRQVASVYQAGGTDLWRTTTSYGGDRVYTTPPAGGVASLAISDARGQTTELRRYRGGAPTGSDFDSTRYTYTPAGELATITDPGGAVWRYGYDLRGRKIRDEDPDKGVSTIVYDVLDRPLTSTDARGRTVAYGYDDPLGRRTAVYADRVGGTRLAAWTYDTAAGGKGMPTSATRYVGGQPYTQKVTAYSALYQPVVRSVVIPETPGTAGLAGSYLSVTKYNDDGTIRGVSVPAAGGLPTESMSFTYDDAGRPLTMTGGWDGTTITYVGDTGYTRYGERQRIQLGEGTKRAWLSYYFDDSTRRVTRSIVDAEVPRPMQADVNYHYDDAGNITSIADTPQGQQADVQCFRYDGLQRLTEAWTPSTGCAADPSTADLSGPAPYWQSFSYDERGNRAGQVRHTAAGDTTSAYHHPADRQAQPHTLTSVSTNGPGGQAVDTYRYDAAGNTLARTVGGTGQTLDWDSEGRLSSISTAGATTSFSYDADGSRLLRHDPDGTTLYLGTQELRRSAATGQVSVTRYYSYGGKVVAQRGTSGLRWLASDHQGTTQVAIDAGDQTVVRQRRTPFGEDRGGHADIPGERGFVGGTEDVGTGLVHLGAREYDPSIGRFLSVDPALDPADIHQLQGYSYADNSPVTLSDPSGLKACADDACTSFWANGQCYHCEPAPAPAPTPPPAPKGSGVTIIGVGQAGIKEAYGRAHDESVLAKRRYKKTTFTIIPIEVQLPSGKQGPGAEYITVPGILIALTFSDMADCKQAMPPQGKGPYVSESPLTRAEQEAWDAAHPPPPPTPRSMTAAEFLASITGADTIVDCIMHPSFDGCLLAAANVAPIPVGKGASLLGKAAKLACSFTAATRVVLGDGTTKPIGELKPGDVVRAADPATAKSQGGRPVAAVLVHTDEDLVDLTVEDATGLRSVVHTTADHPFWDASARTWTVAGSLVAGHRLGDLGGVASVRSVLPRPGRGRMYNLTVTGLHTYYVVAGSASVLVHNQCNFDIAEQATRIADHSKARRMEPGGGDHYVRGVDPAALDAYVDGVLEGSIPTRVKPLERGRVGYWDPDKEAVIIEDGDGGTVFTPENGQAYFDDELE